MPESIGKIDQYLKPTAFSKYANIFQNNIFAVEEIIEVKAQATPTPATKPFSMRLEITGIVITPERKMVMIWDKQKNESHVLLENNLLYQWRVNYIDRHKVILTSESGDRYEFELNVETTAKSTIQR